MGTLYERFTASVGRDGPDYSIISRARGAAREELESDLIGHLQGTEALALAHLQCERAVPHLRAQIHEGALEDRLAKARALWLLDTRPTDLQVIVDTLNKREASTAFTRVTAAWYLEGVVLDEAFAALEAAIFDPEYLVRYNAAMVYSRNSVCSTDERTIFSHTQDFHQTRIAEFIETLRSKRYAQAV